MKLEDKRFVVTGASSGLGRALVGQLARLHGTKVVAVTRHVNLAKPENADKILDFAIARMGGVDCVIACAGFGYYESFGGGDGGFGHIQRIFETNVLSPFYMLDRFLAKTHGKVSFVVISSMLGKMGLAGMSLYSATKHALAGFADAYQPEKPKRLYYATVYPISLKTNFWRKLPADIPIPQPMQTADAAARVVLRGLRKGRPNIYTAPFSRLAAACPLPYQIMGALKFRKWLRQSFA
ncbi:MAG: SDR family NAD(P)-dependent oxidoreductase [Defluviitaleaceae bacterium]|nr:SDR family NAD(P)-dependent oxidoreductase [Defluviitaleaceae bacterium]